MAAMMRAMGGINGMGGMGGMGGNNALSMAMANPDGPGTYPYT